MSSDPVKVFVSYNHRQGEWVLDRLVPVLKAGGADVLVDVERFKAGKGLLGQMDATQEQAKVHLLIFSPDYLASDYCIHEMEQAIACDPNFENGVVIPVRRVDVTLPDAVRHPDPLYADLSDDGKTDAWNHLLDACRADLGTDAPSWLFARDEVRRFLKRKQSVNLVVGPKVAWRPLVNDLQRDDLTDLTVVNLEKGATNSRRGLATEILAALGTPAPIPAEPEDLGELERVLAARPSTKLALTHFDLAAYRTTYDVNLFASLRFMVMDSRRLVLLVQSRRPFATLLPIGHPLSEIDLQTVELRGHR